MSINKMMSTRLGYHVNDNQEFFAMSGTHLAAGFWPVFPTATGSLLNSNIVKFHFLVLARLYLCLNVVLQVRSPISYLE